MNVIVINESSGKAWIRSRRLLSRFLPQLGSRTWAGQVSRDGLEALRLRLKESASKATAIACHVVVTRSRTDLAWTVGSTTCFSEDGRYSFRQTTAKPDIAPSPKRSPVERFAIALTRLAGLLHDLGKSSLAFQEKLKRGHGAEVLRHDILSFLIVAESLSATSSFEAAWLTSLATNPAAAVACVTASRLVPVESQWLARCIDRLASDSAPFMLQSELSTMLQCAPGLATVLWLVLTHHRLPTSSGESLHLDAGRHLNRPPADGSYEVAPLETCLQPYPGVKPWEDASWCAAVAAAASSALAAREEMLQFGPVEFSTEFWVQVSAHILRPALVLSDHIGSIQAEKGLSIKKAFSLTAPAYANLVGATHAGDTLPKHLTRVAKLCRQMTSIALEPRQLRTSAIPDTSPVLRTGLPEQFRWQEYLGTACKEAASHGPTFACIIAETGAGKTLAGLRAMHALSKGALRFTLGLGLRSLTWQSAQAMLEDARIPKKDLTVAVGQAHTLGLDEKARELQQNAIGSPRFGSESADGQQLDAAVSSKELDMAWLEGVCSEKEALDYWGKPALALLSSPIVACTVDHLVSAVTLLRGGDAKLFLRQATADLVLDEIDAYSAADLQTIGKLAFTAGLYGRHVVVMSATMSPAIRTGLFEAWRAGLAVHCKLKNKALQFGVVHAANSCPPQVLPSPSAEQAGTAWTDFTSQVCQAYAAAALKGSRRRLQVHQLEARSSQAAFEEIAQVACELHKAHHTLDPQTGKRVSVGFVRFNTAKNAWRMAEHLANRAAGAIDVRFVAYHSKFPRNYLGVLDATLQQLCHRKKDEAFLETPALRTALTNSSSSDVLVLVCTTTLIETGRDFDFDWSILEPRSVRGEVQAVGRVRRHRQAFLTDSAPNVILLSQPIRSLDDIKKSAWAHPGIEDNPGIKVSVDLAPGVQAWENPGAPPVVRRRLGPPPVITLARDALPVLQWQSAFDAQACLQAPATYLENRIGYLEHTVQAMHLSPLALWDATSERPAPLGWYLGTLAPWNDSHAKAVPFRGCRQAQALFVPRADRIEFFDDESGKYEKALFAVVSAVSASNALIQDLPLQAARLAIEDKHILGAALRIKEGAASFTELTWNPFLGFLE